MVIQIALILLGFVLLVKGADILVDGSSNIAKKFHVSQMVIGLTVVSMGTSMPELFVSTVSAIKGNSDIALGNVIGSNICNLLLILGLSAVIRPLNIKKETKFIDIPLTLVYMIIFAVICNIGQEISVVKGIILLIFFAIFLAYTFYIGKKENKPDVEEETQNENNYPILKNVVFIVLGIVALKYGADFVVDNSTAIAKVLNISDKVIGLTIVAVGTSLPELVTSVTAALKKNSDIAIGNILGSNIFNAFFIIGVASIINPLNYLPSYNYDMILLIAVNLLLVAFPFVGKKNQVTKIKGALYLLIYVGYMAVLFVA